MPSPPPTAATATSAAGAYHPATNTYGQGAFNADDISRAAVVYLRYWKATGSPTSRAAALELLRGLTYLQTASGPNAGNVVLWMQPDGTLHPSADPRRAPDPSDSGASYWLARTTWALGEGYAAFRGTLIRRSRGSCATGWISRSPRWTGRCSTRTASTWTSTAGGCRPGWSWTVPTPAPRRCSASRPTSGPAAPAAARAGAGRSSPRASPCWPAATPQHWPFGAVLPWALSRSVWHAWGAQMPAALARGLRHGLHRPALAAVAATDSGTFDPWLLTSGGPDNGRLPTRIDGSQIAYGVDARMESLLATAASHACPGRSAAGRDHGGVVLRRQRGRRPGLRSRHRRHHRRDRRGRRRQPQLRRRVDDPRTARDAHPGRQPRHRGAGRGRRRSSTARVRPPCRPRTPHSAAPPPRSRPRPCGPGSRSTAAPATPRWATVAP